jgi:hypothetical protein
MPFAPDQFLHFETQRGELRGRHFFLPTPPVTRMEGPKLIVGFHIVGTTGEPELSEGDVKRLLCHVLIQHLPEEGLSEAFESLSDMYTFYLMPAPPMKTLAEPAKTGRGRISEAVVRPVFPISEEE